MSVASQKFYSNMFHQVAKFSITGLSASLVMTFLGGFESVYPYESIYSWF
jgi:hypothetical protein